MKHPSFHHKCRQLRWVLTFLLVLAASPAAGESPPSEGSTSVQLTAEIPYLDLKLADGKTVRLERVQNETNVIDFEFGRTSRSCPPFCIQPISLGPGIETVGELEVIEALRKISAGDRSTLVIDARTSNWLQEGMIPGAVSIPWNKLHLKHTSEEDLLEILEFELGVVRTSELLNFENAKTLIIYCNGNWCGQSSTVIRSLRVLGYPERRLKWYRGGVQAWKMLGLTMILPDGTKVIDPLDAGW
jgi:rhodanese-related sulfurtransferase